MIYTADQDSLQYFQQPSGYVSVFPPPFYKPASETEDNQHKSPCEMLQLFECLFWLSKVGWNPALVLSPTSVIFVLLHTTNLEPHLNTKYFKTILMLYLYHYYTLQLPPQLSLSSLVGLICFKEFVSQSSNTVLLFLASLIIKGSQPRLQIEN